MERAEVDLFLLVVSHFGVVVVFLVLLSFALFALVQNYVKRYGKAAGGIGNELQR